MEETKVIYYIDDEETPYLVKIPISPEKVTLVDFKNQLNRPNYKFFFKSMDDDFGVVKEEIVDDNAHLPCFNGRVVSWLVSAEGSNPSDGASQCTDSNAGKAKTAAHGAPSAPLTRDTCTDTDSTISSRPGHRASCDKYKYRGLRINGHSKYGNHGLEYETASVLSSDLDSTSLFDSQSEITTTTGRHTNASVDRALTECSSVSHLQVSNRKRPQRRRKRPQVMSRTSSYSSITDSTMSMHIITVTLNMDTVNFLGISIVGQSNKGGDGGIYVGSIMKGGAVALDGRIEPGDMILQVNDVNFEDMTNDEAVRVLREVVQKPGPIKLVVAKCWDPNPKGYFTIPRTEPVRPIDPGAWVAHTQALREAYPPPPPSLSALPVSSVSERGASDASTLPAGGLEPQLSVSCDMALVVRAMLRPDSGQSATPLPQCCLCPPSAVPLGPPRVVGVGARRVGRQHAAGGRPGAAAVRQLRHGVGGAGHAAAGLRSVSYTPPTVLSLSPLRRPSRPSPCRRCRSAARRTPARCRRAAWSRSCPSAATWRWWCGPCCGRTPVSQLHPSHSAVSVPPSAVPLGPPRVVGVGARRVGRQHAAGGRPGAAAVRQLRHGVGGAGHAAAGLRSVSYTPPIVLSLSPLRRPSRPSPCRRCRSAARRTPARCRRAAWSRSCPSAATWRWWCGPCCGRTPVSQLHPSHSAVSVPPPPSLSALPVSSVSERGASDASTLPAGGLEPQLSVSCDMALVVRAMLRPDSGQSATPLPQCCLCPPSAVPLGPPRVVGVGARRVGRQHAAGGRPGAAAVRQLRHGVGGAGHAAAGLRSVSYTPPIVLSLSPLRRPSRPSPCRRCRSAARRTPARCRRAAWSRSCPSAATWRWWCGPCCGRTPVSQLHPSHSAVSVPPPPSLSALPVSSVSERGASDASTLPAGGLEPQLSVSCDMALVVRAMLRPDSGQSATPLP
ncbi:uncharacterized protein LOC133531699 isoform X1 [Cydia pomonella]|uniref:uncharacterized protein LOC133531699 isoform X1 n=1 Tax=Cydia pomonella TaxID=82600 RepID=UPI002ADDD994|nr:uncharacterized protein LOC133531699 isoform X1 [Cydia pomonella]